MVRVKYKQKIANIRKAKGVRQKKYRVEELKKDEGVAKQHCKEIQIEIGKKGIEENTDGNIVEEKWQNCKEIIIKSTDKILTRDIKPKKDWFDEDCKRYIEVRNKFLQRPTRASHQEYQEKRRMAKKRRRESKRKWEQEKLEEIEDLAKRQEIRQLYQKTGQLKKGFQPRTSMCKNKKIVGRRGRNPKKIDGAH